MKTKLLIIMLSFLAPAILYSATSTVDICFIKDAGTCQYTEGSVAAVEDTDHTWEDKETGAVTACSETGAVLNVKADLTMPDWMANSVTANTTDYEVDDTTTPTRIIRHGTAVLLLVENNLTDEKGDISWTNNDSVPYEATTVKSGSYSIGPFNDDADAVYSASTIPIATNVIEFSFIYFDDTPPSNRYLWCAWHDAFTAVQMESNFIRVRNGGTWTGAYTTARNVWHDVAVEFNGGDGTRLIVGGIERGTSAGTSVPNTNVQYWGNNSALTQSCMCIMDNMRLSTELRDTYPTIGDY